MTGTLDVSFAPLPPKASDLKVKQRLAYLRNFETGQVEFQRRYGGVVQVPLGPPKLAPRLVVVMSPKGMHDVLTPRNGEYDKDLPIVTETMHFGRSVFNLPHAEWVPRRRTLQPLFTKKHVDGYTTHMASEAAATAAKAIESGRVELDPMSRRLTMQVLGRSVLGLDLGARANEIGPAIHDVLNYVTSRGTAPTRLPYAWPTPKNRRFRRDASVVNTLIDEAIDACRRDASHDAELIRVLLDAKDPETGASLTHDDIRGELFTFVVAGHDTTATTIAYTLWQLGRNPEMQDRVAAEAAEFGDAAITSANLSSLPYTVQVLHESLRLCPPGAGMGRKAKRDMLVDGYRVPEGTNIFLGILALHRDPTLWDDPLRFDPERFSAEKSAGRDRWQYVPFGGGPRSCIGDHFAMLEAAIAVATIVRVARIESLEPEFPLAFPFTLTAGGPIPALVTRR